MLVGEYIFSPTIWVIIMITVYCDSGREYEFASNKVTEEVDYITINYIDSGDQKRTARFYKDKITGYSTEK